MINITDTLTTACIDLEDAIELKDWEIVQSVLDVIEELQYDMERNSDIPEDY